MNNTTKILSSIAILSQKNVHYSNSNLFVQLKIKTTPAFLVEKVISLNKKYDTNQQTQIWPSFLWRNQSIMSKCIFIQVHFPEKVDLLKIQLFFTIVYFIIWFCAICGNLLVLYVVTLKQVKMSSVRSIFICSLTLSDLVLSVTSLPITAVSIFTRDWVFPKFFCNLIGVFQGGSVFVSSFTLAAIAVDCYILIKYPQSKKLNIKTAFLIVFFVWVIGYLLASPVGIFSTIAYYPPYCGIFCDEFCDELGVSQMRKLYGIFVLIIQVGLPVAISSLCYWKIGKKINKQFLIRKKQNNFFREKQNRLEKRKNRSNRMMLTMVFGLVLAWLPMNLINLWRDFESAERNSEWFSLIFAACHVIAMTSAVWNPIIYSLFNPHFKETLKEAFIKKKKLSLLPTPIITSPRRRFTINSINYYIKQNSVVKNKFRSKSLAK